MKPEKINIIFSILFLIWCLPVFFILQHPEIFKFADYKICVNSIYGLIVVTAFFNVLAYFCKKCWFYAVGAIGFLLFFLFHLINIIVFIALLFAPIKDRYMDEHKIFFFLLNFNFPLSFFGLFSTLYCFQQKYNETIDETYSTPESKTTLLKFCIKNYMKLIMVYNVALLFMTLFITVFLIQLVISTRPYVDVVDFLPFLFFLPFLAPILNLISIKLYMKKFCVAVIAIWILFTIGVTAFFGYGIFIDYSRLRYRDFICLLSGFLTFITNVIIFISTTLYILRSTKNDEIESETNASVFFRNEINAKEPQKNQQSNYFTYKINDKEQGKNREPNVNIFFNIKVDYNNYST